MQAEREVDQVQARIAARNQLRERLIQARDELSQGVYRLETIEASIELVEEEIRKLNSLSVAGVFSSLLGSKAGKIDACRRECEDLQREHQQSEQAVASLTVQVERLNSELESYADVAAAAPAPLPDAQNLSPVSPADIRHRLENALDAAESLLNHLGGSFKLCNRLRSGSSPFRRYGALIAAGAQAYRSSVASGVAAQIAGSVQHLCDRIRQLELNPDHPADAEWLAALARLETFADPSAGMLGANSDAWAELEVLTRGFVSDLEDRLSHSGD